MFYEYGGMRVLTVKVPVQLIEIIDRLVEAGLYGSRSEFVREALRTLVNRILSNNKELREKIIRLFGLERLEY